MRRSQFSRGAWTTMCLAGLLACHGAPRSGASSDEGKGAEMQLTLSVDRTQLMVGEDTALTLVLRNDAGQVITVAHPEQNASWPKWRLLRKSTGNTVEFGPTEVMEGATHEYTAPLDDLELDLDAGAQFELASSLLQRVLIPAAGAYALTAVYDVGGREVISAPVNFEVSPLRLHSVRFSGLHSGHTPYQMALWSSSEGRGSVIGVTQLAFSDDGDETRTFSTRVAVSDRPARPVASVTANKLSYSKQWVAWLSGDEVTALYHDYGRPMLPPKTNRVGADNTVMVAPILNDLTGNDGTTPGRGDFALFDRTGGRNQLLLRSLNPTGSLDKGPAVALTAGEFVWAQAALASQASRRFVVLTQGSHECRLEGFDWDGRAASGSAVEIATWPGTAWGAGVTMNENDQLLGVALVQTPDGAQAMPWRRSIDGKVLMMEAIDLQDAPVAAPRRVIVEVGPAGEFLAALETQPGEWMLCGSHGRCVRLPDALAALGEPVGVFWRSSSSPMLVLADENAGLRYANVPRF